jgi:hypothetical protein
MSDCGPSDAEAMMNFNEAVAVVEQAGSCSVVCNGTTNNNDGAVTLQFLTNPMGTFQPLSRCLLLSVFACERDSNFFILLSSTQQATG